MASSTFQKAVARKTAELGEHRFSIKGAAGEKNTPRAVFFMGSDIISLAVANLVIPKIIEWGIKPLILWPEYTLPSKASNPHLEELNLFQNRIPQEALYKTLDHSVQPMMGEMYSPSRLDKSHTAIETRHITNINDPQLISAIQNDPSTAFGVSFRVYQKFSPAMIGAFGGKNVKIGDSQGNMRIVAGNLVNLHPGNCPSQRGVLPPVRTIMSGENHQTCTMHVIDEDFDTGPIIHKFESDAEVAHDKHVMDVYIQLIPQFVDSILQTTLQFMQGQDLSGKEQPEDNIHYFTYPSKGELAAFEEQGNSLVNPQAMLDLYLELFTTPERPRHKEAVISALKTALEDHGYNNLDYTFGREQSTGPNNRKAPSTPGFLKQNPA